MLALFFQFPISCFQTFPVILLHYCASALVNLSSHVMLLLLLVMSKCKSNGLSKSKCNGKSNCNGKSTCNGKSKCNAISIMECNVVTNPSIVSAFAANLLLVPNSKLPPGFFFLVLVCGSFFVCAKFHFLSCSKFQFVSPSKLFVFPFRPHGSVYRFSELQWDSRSV